MSALIIQHPKAKVQFDSIPPCTPESAARAKAAMLAEREAIGYHPPSSDDVLDQLEARELLRGLIRTQGADRIIRWARFEAWIAGQDVE